MKPRTWLITGCSAGFGRVLAQVLLERGDRVALTARRPEVLEPLAAPYGDRALALPLDVTQAGQIESTVAAAIAHFGAIDVLVNNAGGGQIGTVEDTPVEAARAMMETNYFGALAMIKAVLPHMLARGSGQIVNIGSVAGQIGFPLIGTYSASKFALAGLTESLAAEMAGQDVHVTLAELGPFATNFTAAMAIVPPSPRYDPAALSLASGHAHWGAGADAREGALALLAALDAPEPPRKLLLGPEALKVVTLHEARRLAEREQWMDTILLTDKTSA
jgi:short-subunit dehydrogenase